MFQYAMLKLDRYVGPVPTYYAAARLATHIQHLLIIVRGINGSIVFSIVAKFFFLCYHDNSRTAALSLKQFCLKMYFDNR